MSGGSLDYAYQRVQDAAELILIKSKNTTHRAFGKHLLKISKALKDLEWVLSGDSSSGEEIESINNVLFSGAELDSIIEDVKIVLGDLTRALNKTNWK